MSKRKADGHGASSSSTSGPERLISLRATSFASQSALNSILADVKSGGAPDSFSRASQYRARKDLCHTETPYGKLVTQRTLEVTRGKPITVAFLNPFAFIHYCCERSKNYSVIMLNALDRNPSSPSNPWHIVLYQDGVDPGDGLAKNKSRHEFVFYWSFLEFGMAVLCHEEVWGTATVMRTVMAKRLPGGVTELTHRVLEQFHNDEHDMRITGVNILCQGSQNRHRIFGKVRVLMSDIPALTEMLSSKGHGALKPCACCQNATHHKPPGGAVPIHVYSEYCVQITDTNIENFKQHTNESLRQVATKLQELKVTKSGGVLEHLETNVYGYTWTPWSIIANARFGIDAADAIMFDWAHLYVSDGLADVEFGEYMKAMHVATTQGGIGHTCTYSTLGDYLKGWKWPKSRGSPLHLFEPEKTKRFIKSGDFNCSASEFLSLAPLIKRFLERVVMPQVESIPGLRLKTESMIAVLKVLDILQKCKLKGAVTPDKLRTAIKTHLDLFKACHDVSDMRPKHHYPH
jgi:hypothetical protein